MTYATIWNWDWKKYLGLFQVVTKKNNKKRKNKKQKQGNFMPFFKENVTVYSESHRILNVISAGTL